MSRTSIANLSLRIDYENNAEAWWDAARARARSPEGEAEGGAEIFRRFDRAGDKGLDVSADEVTIFEAWAAALPGFDDGPAYAPRPYLVAQDDGEE